MELDLASIKHEAIRRELAAALHKLAYPMADILAKLPGESLSERARAVGVSRNTFYKWLNEKMRPTGRQAKAIAKLTGVPVEHIEPETGDGAEGAFAAAAQGMAQAGEGLSGRAARLRAKRKRISAQQRKRRHDRKARA